MDANLRMAARDFAAAAEALKSDHRLTALSLALDAIASLTAEAGEGRGTFIPYGEECASQSREPWTEEKARELYAFAEGMLQRLPTFWRAVKHYRLAVDRKTQQR